MAKNIGKLAARYAKALVRALVNEVARATSGRDNASIQSSVEFRKAALESVAELSRFAKVWAEEETLQGSMLNPMFEKGQRAKALKRILSEMQMLPIVARFVELCFERDRLSFIGEIAQAFNEQANQAVGIKLIEITTASKLSADEMERIELGLMRHLAGALKFTWIVDTSILAGMRIAYDGKVVDGSVAGRLARLEAQLMQLS